MNTCPKCEQRANGSTVLISSIGLKELQIKIKEQEDRIAELESLLEDSYIELAGSSFFLGDSNSITCSK